MYMGSLIKLDARFAQFISIERVHDVSAYDSHARITLTVPWPVAEQLANFAAPFLSAIKDSVDLRTVKEAERHHRAASDMIRHGNRTAQQRITLLRVLKRVYREGIDYWKFCELIERDRYGLASTDRHMLYHDARARACDKMLRAGKTRKEAGALFGITPEAVGVAIKKRLHEGGAKKVGLSSNPITCRAAYSGLQAQKLPEATKPALRSHILASLSPLQSLGHALPPPQSLHKC